ncbi:hypothetical protein [Pseudomonas sp. 2835]|uniref:hypothetical protein n=1 Tax=Pseudomonas sp. 2835 TaxID=3156451 RepID=UPI003D1C0370
MSIRHFYKTEAPAIVAIVQEFYTKKAEQQAALVVLGEAFGGQVASMRDITCHYAGGVKLSASKELDVYWRRPDEYGYRSLRSTPLLPKGGSKEDRAAYKAEHSRLLELWAKLCPPRLSNHTYWEKTGINTGNLLLNGGIKFELDGVAYFNLGYHLDQAKHLEKVAAGQPSYGWIEGVIEITASEYETARNAREEAFKAAKGVSRG